MRPLTLVPILFRPSAAACPAAASLRLRLRCGPGPGARRLSA
ncbi:hypothetical protein ACTTAF_03775 [Rhodobacter capsulatus]